MGCWILGAVGEVWVHLQPTCCPRRSVPWVSRRYLLQLGSGEKQQVEVERQEGKDLWDPQEMERAGKFAKGVLCKDGHEIVRLELGEQRERRSCIKIFIALKC